MMVQVQPLEMHMVQKQVSMIVSVPPPEIHTAQKQVPTVVSVPPPEMHMVQKQVRLRLLSTSRTLNYQILQSPHIIDYSTR
jgi:hypothetical protein